MLFHRPGSARIGATGYRRRWTEYRKQKAEDRRQRIEGRRKEDREVARRQQSEVIRKKGGERSARAWFHVAGAF